jgi:sugar phosphate isomerase/epimerase
MRRRHAMESQRHPFKYSYFQLTFGQEEAYLKPHLTYERLRRFGYDAIEICPPKGRYGLGVTMEDYLATHLQLKADFGLEVSNVNECWGEMWDPFSPTYKTLTEPRTAELAVSETRTTIDFAAELGAMSVTIATAIHAPITAANVEEATAVAVDSLRRMGEHAARRGIRLVFEATNHLEMGKFVNTASNHKRIIELTGRQDIGIQLDFFHVNLEELSAYEAVMDAQPLLWHCHFRDSNSLTPGYGKTDFRAVMRGLIRTGYLGYCTIESAPMVPSSDQSARDGIEFLKLAERIAEYQLSAEYPNGFGLPTVLRQSELGSRTG